MDAAHLVDSTSRNLQFWIETFEPFGRLAPWTESQLQAVAWLQTALRADVGTTCKLSLGRGQGSTSLSEAALLWALLHGHRRRAVVIRDWQDQAAEAIARVVDPLVTRPGLQSQHMAVAESVTLQRQRGGRRSYVLAVMGRVGPVPAEPWIRAYGCHSCFQGIDPRPDLVLYDCRRPATPETIQALRALGPRRGPLTLLVTHHTEKVSSAA